MRKKIFLCVSFVFFIISCKDEPKTIAFSEVEKTTKNNAIVQIHIPEASQENIIGKNINDEIERFVAGLLTIGEPEIDSNNLSLEAEIEAFNTAYKDFIKDFPESNQIWEAQIDGEVAFSSSEVITIAITSYLNTGGAHGNTNISFLNFDFTTGKPIPNENLFKNIDGFKTLAKTYFDKAVENKSVLFEPDSFDLPANMGYTEEGIILLYNPYEIAPYAKGIIDFNIPFENAKDYLTFQGL
ncbi:DUF3298 and DUF4163 domain-containing protein [Hyunsoonleella rubra]|uniref:DUF3298 domain-containing protein n=1 Tax=Hyunsoonleella rubra TaxID=1737062 RepID=A0ABW5TCE2_9FLAO